MESIVLAFMKEEISQKIKKILDSSGIPVNGICSSKAELMRYIANLGSGIIITGFRLPDATAEEIHIDLPESFSIMVIATAEQTDYMNKDIFTLTLPIKGVELASSVNFLLKSRQTHTKQVNAKKRKEEEKKIIAQAKLVLMERHRMTEEQAHRFIQKHSMDAGVKMIDTARLILS